MYELVIVATGGAQHGEIRLPALADQSVAKDLSVALKKAYPHNMIEIAHAGMRVGA